MLCIVIANELSYRKIDGLTQMELAAIVGFVSGMFMLGLGLLRAGFLVKFLNHAVISGFSTAAAVILIVTQGANCLGITGVTHNRYFAVVAVDLLRKLGHVRWIAILNSAIAMAILFGMQRLKRSRHWPARFKFVNPDSIIVVTVGAILGFALRNTRFPLATIGYVTVDLTDTSFPVPKSWTFFLEILPTVSTVTLVAVLETLSIASRTARKLNEDVRGSREVTSLGLTNVIMSIMGGMPVAASFSRSAINETAGSRSPVSSVVAGALVIGLLYAARPVLSYIPTSSLG